MAQRWRIVVVMAQRWRMFDVMAQRWRTGRYITAAKRVYICIGPSTFSYRERVGFEHPTSREQVIYVNHSRHNDRLMYRAQTVIIAQSIFLKMMICMCVYGSRGRIATGATVASVALWSLWSLWLREGSVALWLCR